MSTADVHEAQEKGQCACVRLDPADCIRTRSGLHLHDEDEWPPFAEDDRCGCSCHDAWYRDDDLEEP